MVRLAEGAKLALQRLSRKGVGWLWGGRFLAGVWVSVSALRGPLGWCGGGGSRCRWRLGELGGAVCLPELEEVVGGGDESPLRSARGDAPALESGDVAVVLDLAEDGLDRVFFFAVKDAAV